MVATNVLALPAAIAAITTGNNEDLIESLVYLVDSIDPVTGTQLDLSAIHFEMEVRRNAFDSEVILNGSTDDGRIIIGAPPDYGFLIIFVPASEMKNRQPGDYVGDIRASDGRNTRVCVRFTLTIVEGITR